MKKITLVFLLISSAFGNLSAATQYTVSLLTADPGDKFYSVFGHSAIRIKTDISNCDFVYNFGMFSPSKPDLFYNLVGGRMIYYMNKEPYEEFISQYKKNKRSVREQILNMDSVKTMFIFDLLEDNYKNENRYYQYKFLHNNCATRIRDIVMQAFYDIKVPESHKTSTYRNLAHRYLQKHPWEKIVIDITFGMYIDQEIDSYEQMFLPDYLSDILAKASSHGQPIVKDTNNLFVSKQSSTKSFTLVTPTVVCYTVLVLSVLFSFIKKWSRFFNFVLFFVVGMIGVLISFLWFFSDHSIVAVDNWNIIWALPTHIVMVFFLLPSKYSNFTRKYFLVTAIVSLSLILSWIFLPQQLNPTLIPLILAIALRGIGIYKRNVKQARKE